MIPHCSLCAGKTQSTRNQIRIMTDNSGSTTSAPVTVNIVRSIKPGCETEFERELHEFVQRSLQQPGQLGVHIMRPALGSASREYGIVRKFKDHASMQDFYQSLLYRDWNRTAKPLTDGETRYEELCGLESWFTLPGTALLPLPKWKMAIVTFLGVYPVSLVVMYIVGPLTPGWHFLLRNILINVCLVSLLTWVVMPLLTLSLHRWLHNSQGKQP